MFHREPKPQTYANHKKFSPAYHLVAFPLLLLSFGWAVIQFFRAPDFGGGVAVGLGLALLILFLAIRIFALSVQDRVIRLEERLRFERLLPDDLRARIDELELGQIVSLRFASDGELPSLVRTVLNEKIVDRTAIKKRITSWRPDYLRC